MAIRIAKIRLNWLNLSGIETNKWNDYIHTNPEMAKVFASSSSFLFSLWIQIILFVSHRTHREVYAIEYKQHIRI